MYWLVDAIADRDGRTLGLLAVALLAGATLLGWYVLAR